MSYFIPTLQDNILLQNLQKENEALQKSYKDLSNYAELWRKRYFAILDNKCEDGTTHHRAKINSLCNNLVESQLDKVIEYIESIK